MRMYVMAPVLLTCHRTAQHNYIFVVLSCQSSFPFIRPRMTTSAVVNVGLHADILADSRVYRFPSLVPFRLRPHTCIA